MEGKEQNLAEEDEAQRPQRGHPGNNQMAPSCE